MSSKADAIGFEIRISPKLQSLMGLRLTPSPLRGLEICPDPGRSPANLFTKACLGLEGGFSVVTFRTSGGSAS